MVKCAGLMATIASVPCSRERYSGFLGTIRICEGYSEMILDCHLPPDTFSQLDFDRLVPPLRTSSSGSWFANDLMQPNALRDADCCTGQCGVQVAHAEVVCDLC